ncbi:hypothetical protein KS4_01030 [Poriferisphaera corsica]|uniref:Uncharacterized protein n=1 Tax=Poriferisphaera corsica TaxID=2528020 RepID=A0A517YPB6_9BACT|nr:hypothetical protein KS4_01030 [Poriferisphaera corsica]
MGVGYGKVLPMKGCERAGQKSASCKLAVLDWGRVLN